MNNYAVKTRIEQLTAQIKQTTVNIGFSGLPNKTSADHSQLMMQVARFENALSGIAQAIKNQMNFIHMTTGPAAQRTGGHPVKDRNRSLTMNMNELQRSLIEALRALAGLNDAVYGNGNAMKTALEAISGGLENILKEDETLNLTQQGQQQVSMIIQSQGSGTPPAPMPNLVGHGVDIFVILWGTLAIIKARLQQK